MLVPVSFVYLYQYVAVLKICWKLELCSSSVENAPLFSRCSRHEEHNSNAVTVSAWALAEKRKVLWRVSTVGARDRRADL